MYIFNVYFRLVSGQGEPGELRGIVVMTDDPYLLHATLKGLKIARKLFAPSIIVHDHTTQVKEDTK